MEMLFRVFDKDDIEFIVIAPSVTIANETGRYIAGKEAYIQNISYDSSLLRLVRNDFKMVNVFQGYMSVNRVITPYKTRSDIIDEILKHIN